jgi:hypothetical protein
MIQIITKIIVEGKSPQQIFDWMRTLNQEKYHQWHPVAHKDFKRIKETENLIGSVIYFDEIFEGIRVREKWEIIEVKRNLPISFEVGMKAKTFYPMYLYLSGKKTNKDTEITHTLFVGFSFKGLEKIFDWFVKNFILSEKKIKALERHVIEEFKNLENII